jgi:mono/diheme cytochrome c family protein
MATMKKYIAIVLLTAGLYSCDSHTYEDIEADTPPITEKVTYEANAKAIIDANCISCHSADGIVPYRPLTTYEEVKEAVLTTNLLDRIQLQNGEPGIMPQGGRMAQSNIDILLQWNTDGLLEN